MRIEAIILAGGLGTRLRSAVPDLPKCMAPVNDKPFISYVIKYLQQQGVTNFIFSLGYKSEVIEEYLQKEFPNLLYKTSIEDEPLGTGGAIKQALTIAEEKVALATNGDTLFIVNVNELLSLQTSKQADCTLSLKPMKNFDRYGVVDVDDTNAIKSFKEKQLYESGCINGGVYALDKESFLKENLPQKFSFEKNYLETYYDKRAMYGLVQDEYFIDIGIPEDYERAQVELKGF